MRATTTAHHFARRGTQRALPERGGGSCRIAALTHIRPNARLDSYQGARRIVSSACFMKDGMLSSSIEQDAFRLDAQLLSDLWVFRAAARHGSITGAAAALNVTQGAVSQRVLRLEARLGTELFRRSQRKITLTPAGMTLLGAVNGASAGLNDALSRIAPFAGRRAGGGVPAVAGDRMVDATLAGLLPRSWSFGRRRYLIDARMAPAHP
jgi:hypothetical protein